MVKRITEIREQERRKERVNIYLDGKFAIALSLETALLASLRVGQALSEADIETLSRSETFNRAYNAAVRLLSYRPRSEAELHQRLRRRFNEDVIDEVVNKLKEQGLLDDIAFIRFWQESRTTFSPRGKRLIRAELRAKGISPELAEEVLEPTDEEEEAYRAAKKKAKSLSSADYETFRKRISGFLQRRGFGYDNIGKIVRRLWQEKGLEQ